MIGIQHKKKKHTHTGSMGESESVRTFVYECTERVIESGEPWMARALPFVAFITSQLFIYILYVRLSAMDTHNFFLDLCVCALSVSQYTLVRTARSIIQMPCGGGLQLILSHLSIYSEKKGKFQFVVILRAYNPIRLSSRAHKCLVNIRVHILIRSYRIICALFFVTLLFLWFWMNLNLMTVLMKSMSKFIQCRELNAA